MRLALIATVSALLATAALCDASHYAEYISKFSAFKKEYNRTYATPEEEAKRLHIFIENLKDAAVLQKRNPLAKFGVNAYTDLSKEEFKGRHNAEAYFRAGVRRRRSREVKEDPKVLAKARSNSVDWRNQGVVTPIKNQGQCGGCWAFSTTGNIEGQWAIAGNPLTSLSEQELISCVNTCNGCNGGLMDNAFNWLIDANGGGITSESQYPFESASGSVPACQSGSVSSVATITSLVDVAHSESYMASWVAENGPLSIGVDATSWQTFGGGIMTDCVSNQVDHAVLIVGYNFDASPAYWIIKNQWGTSWGNDGYMYLEYGSNECLLTTIPSSSQV